MLEPSFFTSTRPVATATERADSGVTPGPFRVLKLAPTSFFADYGCHVRILEEALALKRLGSDVVVCTYPAGRDVEGVSTVRSMGLPRGGEIRVGSSRHKLYLDALLSLSSAQTALTYRPDVVHGHLHEGALIGVGISRLARCPLVFDFQGSLTAEMVDHGFLSPTSGFYRPLRWIENSVCRLADAIITSSVSAADLLIRDFDCPASKIIPVPDGVDTDVFRPRWDYTDQDRYRIRSALGVPPGRKVVVYLGLLAEYQGSSYLLRAAARVLRARPEVHFLLMGYPGEARYRSLADELGIGGSVTFTGRVPYDRAPRYLAAGDIAVAPKLSVTEANGKLLNYMALGLPTVAFDSAVSRDVLGPPGVFATHADAEDLARKLLLLLDDVADASQRGVALRRRAEEKFSWMTAGRSILGVYEHLRHG